MKKTIQGRRFDTDTATLIGSYCMDPEMSDMSWWGATLYVTPLSKRFFLAGEGGMMTRWRDGEGIFELTREEACAWIEEYLGKVKDYLEEAA